MLFHSTAKILFHPTAKLLFNSTAKLLLSFVVWLNYYCSTHQLNCCGFTLQQFCCCVSLHRNHCFTVIAKLFFQSSAKLLFHCNNTNSHTNHFGTHFLALLLLLLLQTTQTELVLKVFLRLVEDVVAFQNIPAQRRREILQALTSIMQQLFHFFLQILDAYRAPAATSVCLALYSGPHCSPAPLSSFPFTCTLRKTKALEHQNYLSLTAM